MENKKTYNVRKVGYIAIGIALFLVGLIYLASLTLGRFQTTLLEDTGFAWYYWKLPEVSIAATISAWTLYVAHQIVAWILIVKISKEPMPEKGKMSKLNVIFLIVNAVFIMLHIAQTMLFYDGLAQYVPVISSQGSVIIMLVMVLILLNSRRGLFFGKKVKFPNRAVSWIYKSHGLYIAWALVYTFWFHPTEGTIGHLMGFFYMFMLMIQMSLANTSWHNDIRWNTILEVYVAVHGAIVAIEAGNGMWPMFMFGFLFMFIMTEAYGLTKKRGTLITITIVYFALAVLVFSGVLGNQNTISDIYQITWIPVILYGLVFVVVFLYQGAYLISKKLGR